MHVHTNGNNPSSILGPEPLRFKSKKAFGYLAKRHFSITNQKFPETSWQPYSYWHGFSTKDSKRRYSGAQIRAKHGKKRECVQDEKRKEFRSPKTPCGKSMEELQSTSEALG